MKISDSKRHASQNVSPLKIDDIIDELFHDAQNNIHRVGMELELVSMGLGNSSDAAKTAEMVKLLENNVRDLRGYISAVQEPSASCEPAAVLDAIVANLRISQRGRRGQVSWIPPVPLPRVALHKKLLARVLERVLDFCENLMPMGGDLRIAADRRESSGELRVEISLTMLSAAPIDGQADKEFLGEVSVPGRAGHGIIRAVKVLRRHRGDVSFLRQSDSQCEITLSMRCSPQ